MSALCDKNGFLIYKTSKAQILKAKELFEARFLSSLSLNSKTVYKREESRLAGIVGEIVYQSIFPNAIKTSDKNISFDFYHDNKKVDVKCKYRTVEPRSNFEASFFAYQANFEEVDKYVFMSTKDDFSIVWICGYIDKKDFMQKAILWKKGQTDPSNHKTFHEDTYSVFYSQLSKYNKSELS